MKVLSPFGQKIAQLKFLKSLIKKINNEINNNITIVFKK